MTLWFDIPPSEESQEATSEEPRGCAVCGKPLQIRKGNEKFCTKHSYVRHNNATKAVYGNARKSSFDSEGEGWEPPWAHCPLNLDSVEGGERRLVDKVDYDENEEPHLLRPSSWFRTLSKGRR